MKRLSGKKALLYICAPVTLIILANLAGIRFNYSHSVAGRFWYESHPDQYVRGDYIFLCIEDERILKQLKPYLINGDCGGSVGMLKRVVGVSGDEARFTAEGIFINGEKIANTKPIDNESLRYQLDTYKQSLVIPAGHVVLAGETHDSLDSRYYGPIDTKWITGKATKLL